MSEIWVADWVFYTKGIPIIVPAVVTKKIPLRFLISKRDSYDRAMRDLDSRIGKKGIDALDVNKSTGLKKFEVKFIKKIGY